MTAICQTEPNLQRASEPAGQGASVSPNAAADAPKVANNRGGYEAADAILAAQQKTRKAAEAARLASADRARSSADAAVRRDAQRQVTAADNVVKLSELAERHAPLRAALEAGKGAVHFDGALPGGYVLSLTPGGFTVSLADYYRANGNPGSFLYFKDVPPISWNPLRLLFWKPPTYVNSVYASLDLERVSTQLDAATAQLPSIAESGELPKEWSKGVRDWFISKGGRGWSDL